MVIGITAGRVLALKISEPTQLEKQERRPRYDHLPPHLARYKAIGALPSPHACDARYVSARGRYDAQPKSEVQMRRP